MKNYFKLAYQWFCDYASFMDKLESGLDAQQQLELIRSGKRGFVKKAIRRQEFNDEAVMELMKQDVQQLSASSGWRNHYYRYMGLLRYYDRYQYYSLSVYAWLSEQSFIDMEKIGVSRIVFGKMQQYELANDLRAFRLLMRDPLPEIRRFYYRCGENFLEELRAAKEYVEKCAGQREGDGEDLAKDLLRITSYEIAMAGDAGPQYVAVETFPDWEILDEKVEECWPSEELQRHVLDQGDEVLIARMRRLIGLSQYLSDNSKLKERAIIAGFKA